MIEVRDTERHLLSLVGEAWTVPVMACLDRDGMRFGNIRRLLAGIGQKQLARTLKCLEQDGFVTRTAYFSIPPRVEYRVTDLGEKFLESVAVLTRFATDHAFEIENARSNYDLVRSMMIASGPPRFDRLQGIDTI